MFRNDPGRKNTMRKQIILTLLLTMSLAACVIPIGGASTAPSDTATISPTATATETQTPTPEDTATPTETPTPEVKQFPICQIENFRDCPITVDDLFNGEYHRWLKTLSKPFDPAKLKWVPMQLINGPGLPVIGYDTNTAPNYRDRSTAPFRRNITSGITTYQGSDYLIIPIEYADPQDPGNPEKNVWVIGVMPIIIKANEQLVVNVWKNKMNIAPIVTSDTYWSGDGRQVSLITKSFAQDPKMAEHFQNFLAGNVNALDGKVVQIEIATTTYHGFE